MRMVYNVHTLVQEFIIGIFLHQINDIFVCNKTINLVWKKFFHVFLTFVPFIYLKNIILLPFGLKYICFNIEKSTVLITVLINLIPKL